MESDAFNKAKELQEKIKEAEELIEFFTKNKKNITLTLEYKFTFNPFNIFDTLKNYKMPKEDIKLSNHGVTLKIVIDCLKDQLIDYKKEFEEL